MSSSRDPARKLSEKMAFTTGEAAKILGVSIQTVIRLVQRGMIQAHQIPTSGHRRIPRENLLTYMRTNDIPAPIALREKARVLVVDDEIAILQMVSEMLERNGLEVAVAANGFEAGFKAKDWAPDVIVLDYMLPDFNGDAVVRTVKADPQTSHAKILIVSGVVNEQEVSALLREGADGFLKKPFNMSELVDRVKSLARQRRSLAQGGASQ